MQHAPEPPIKDPAQTDASKGDALKIYSMEEVEKHDTRDSAWFVHKGQVRLLKHPDPMHAWKVSCFLLLHCTTPMKEHP